LIEATVQNLRFGTVGELTLLCSIFSDGFLCNRQKRRPCLGKSLTLNLNDALNVALSDSGHVKRFLKQMSGNGVDFAFDRSSELCIAVRYKRHIFGVDSPKLCGKSTNNSDSEDNSL
jgi:hypothetical protein